MQASIVIRTYNEARYLPELLAAIERQTVPADEREIIVVDSGSKDGTLEIASAAGCEIVHIAQNLFSFGRSLNYGCEVARGDSLVFISGHCVPTSNTWLERLIAPLQSGEAAITYGRQVGGPETKFSEHRLLLKFFPADNVPPPHPFFCNNANAALRRDVWNDFRFDELLTGLEDMDLGRRVTDAGHKIKYVPDANVFHYHHESWRQVKRRYERESIALQKICPEVHLRPVETIAYYLTAVTGDWSSALSEGRLIKCMAEIAAFRFCQYYGSWRGNHIHRKLSDRAKRRYFFPT